MKAGVPGCVWFKLLLVLLGFPLLEIDWIMKSRVMYYQAGIEALIVGFDIICSTGIEEA